MISNIINFVLVKNKSGTNIWESTRFEKRRDIVLSGLKSMPHFSAYEDVFSYRCLVGSLLSISFNETY